MALRQRMNPNPMLWTHCLGNSPDIIFHNYLELLTQTQGKSWFEIKPEERGNVISINSVG